MDNECFIFMILESCMNQFIFSLSFNFMNSGRKCGLPRSRQWNKWVMYSISSDAQSQCVEYNHGREKPCRWWKCDLKRR